MARQAGIGDSRRLQRLALEGERRPIGRLPRERWAEESAVSPAQARTISYQGVLEQALRDVSAWVERGAKPPTNTRYSVVESQVQVPARADQRGGIQPVVTLKANGRERADVAVGEPVTFVADITVLPNTGKVVAAEWDLLGEGNYPVPGQIAAPGSSVTVKTTYSYSKPGTYFPVIRVASQREADVKTPYARVQNLGRVRVVVKWSSRGHAATQRDVRTGRSRRGSSGTRRHRRC
jgi:hypothetical protein